MPAHHYRYTDFESAPDSHTLRLLMSFGENRFCHVLVIADPWGVSYELGLSISSFIEEFSPEYWSFANPGTFTVCFDDQNNGRQKAENLKSRFPDFVKQILAENELSIGNANGSMFVSINDDGKWVSVLGKSFLEASRCAMRRP